MKEFIKLYRPVGKEEMDQISQSGMKRFPPRGMWQPIFYPVLDLEFATKIAELLHSDQSFVVTFEIPKDYFDTWKIYDQELRIPAYQLEEFNDNIVGLIEVEMVSSLLEV